MNNKFNQAYNLLHKHNQLHILKYWNELTEQQKTQLCNQILKIQLTEPNHTLKQEIIDKINFKQTEPNNQILSLNTNESKYELDGLKVIANNQLALITLAGGLSKRLSVSYPKGVYSIDLLSNKSLFQLHAERLIRIKYLANKKFPNEVISLPWYLMLSEHTYAATFEFFKENNYFGLNCSDVIFFKQEMLPLFHNNKLVLENKYTIKLAPNGTGGLLKALLHEHILNDMNKRNIKFLHICGIENVLLKVADPLFTGLCLNTNSKLVAKIVDKTRYNEPINNLCFMSNQLSILNFSFNTDLATQLLFDSSSDESVLNLGDISCYFLDFNHLKSLVKLDLNYYKFNDRFTVLNENGREEKLRCDYYETLLTDVFGKDCKFYKVNRSEEYAPLEYMFSKSLFHTKMTCKKSLINLHLSWLTKAGARFYYPESKEMICLSKCDIQNLCEVSPLVSYNGEDLEQFVKGKCFEPPLVLELDPDTNQVTFNGLCFNDFNESYPTDIKENIIES